MCRLFTNLGASTSWNPKGLSRPVMGLLYLYLIYTTYERQLSRLNGCKLDHRQVHASVLGFALSSVSNTVTLILLYDFFLLHNFVTFIKIIASVTTTTTTSTTTKTEEITLIQIGTAFVIVYRSFN
jgi:hypothetical protein